LALDLLLGNDRKTNNEITTIAMQHLRKYATKLEPLLGSGPHATLEMLLQAMFPMLYDSTDQVQLVQCSGVERICW
jgi:hypothetical protein